MLTLDVDSRELMARAQAGDRDAFGELTAGLRPYIRGVLHHCASFDPATVDDLIQETLLRAWRGIGGYRPGPVRPWLATIAWHVAVDHHRAQTAGTRCTESLFGLPEDLPQTAGPDPYRAVDDHHLVTQLLGALTDEHRLVLRLRYLTGLSAVEIAAWSGLPLGTVKSRLHYARKAARRLVANDRINERTAA